MNTPKSRINNKTCEHCMQYMLKDFITQNNSKEKQEILQYLNKIKDEDKIKKLAKLIKSFTY